MWRSLTRMYRNVTGLKVDRLLIVSLKWGGSDMREDGFYWVRYKALGWIVAEQLLGVWSFKRRTYDYTDEDFDEIDERRIVRPE